jgi:hypothetical protein
VDRSGRGHAGLAGLGAAATALGFAALRSVFFLDTDEAETASVLADDPRAFDRFVEAAEELFKALRITEFDPHLCFSSSS